MPKKIKIEVIAECCYDEDRNVSTIRTSMKDFAMEISKGEEAIGSVSGCFGADIELRDRRAPGSTGIYYIHPIDLWNAFQDAMKKKGYIDSKIILDKNTPNKGMKDEPKN
jgi:hypothetical protein